MRIASFLKNSFIDYPGKIAAVVFTIGCNFVCPFCHNPDLVTNSSLEIDIKEFLDFLKKRKKWLNGVCITGGEPTLHNDIDKFIYSIKEIGYSVKLDTNGTNPLIVKKLIENNLIDMIAIDIKHVFNKYELATGKKNITSKIKKTIEIVRNSNIEKLFRTTVVPFMHEKNDILEIKKFLKDEKYIIQAFRPGNCLEPDFNEIDPFTKEQFNEFEIIIA